MTVYINTIIGGLEQIKCIYDDFQMNFFLISL